MKTITSFEELIEHLRQRGDRKRVAVVWGEDESSQEAVLSALDEGFIDAIFVGCREAVERNEALMGHKEHVTIVDTDDRDEAARMAVAMVRDGRADILMKGLINTDNLLHAVLNKETGILPKGQILTHITVAKIPTYHKMLVFGDAAVIPYPSQAQRMEQVRKAIYICHSLGIEEPRLSLIHCSEKVNEKFFPHTVGYLDIIEAARNGEFGRCIVDGPLDVKVSCCKESAVTKGIDSPVAGETDAMIFPDIEAANVFYKTITFFCKAGTAGILQGALSPVVLPSRSDSKESKLYSLAIASL